MRTPRGTIILSCIIFVALGILSAGIGPVLLDLAANTTSTLETVGSIFTAIFLGAFLAQIISGTLADRLGPRPVVITGMLLFSAGMLGVSFSRSLPIMLACALFAGLGHGAMDISVNILVARVFQDHSVTAVNLVNFFFGIGAVAGPAIASFTINQWKTGIPVLWIGAGVMVLTAPFVAFFLMSPREKPINTINQASEAPFFLSPLLWLAGLILFLYVGAESSMGGWTATYMQQTTLLTAGKSALVVSGFWMALTLGRLVASFLGSRWGAIRLLTTCLIGASVGGLMLALTTGAMIPTIIAVLLIGFFFGPIFPTTFSISASQFSQSSGKATGLIVALASLGGMSLPAIQGIVLTRFGNNPSVWLIALYTIAMVVINFGRNRVVKKETRQSGMAAIPVK